MMKLRKTRKSTKNKRIDWEDAADVYDRVVLLVEKLQISWVNSKQIKCFRSYNSNARAYARIWGLPRVWQKALNKEPFYIVEVLSERFDHLNQKQKDKILLHEISHIPKNFSGALVAHTRQGKTSFYSKLKELEKKYESSYRRW